MDSLTDDRSSPAPTIQLGYSTNVHRGESLAAVYRYLKAFTIPVKRRVFGKAPGGLELRVGIGIARELRDRGRRREFREFLEDSGLEIFSINAYPLGDFQARRVKERAYAPSWTDGARARWTIAIAGILADLLPDGRGGSISTLAGTYRSWGSGAAARRRMVQNYLGALEALARIEERTGKRIVLAVEPEPDTTLETAAEVIRFFQEELLPGARQAWKRRYRSRGGLETALRRHFTVNLDTCHLSVVFQSPAQALLDLAGAGISTGKIHATSALALRQPFRSPAGYAALRGLHEPRFLHQVVGAGTGRKVIWRGRDLGELPRRLRRGDFPPVQELRTHFHVPLFLRRWGRLRTTQEETREALRLAVSRGLCGQIAFETYTWPVLKREEDLADGLVREFRWLLDAIGRRA